MIRRVSSMLIVAGVLVAASQASAACRRVGTQLDCGLEASQIVIGTQVPDEQTRSRSFRSPPSHGTDAVAGDQAVPAPSFKLELQDIDAGASLCRDIRNESYCD
jgi:hypothetical protein